MPRAFSRGRLTRVRVTQSLKMEDDGDKTSKKGKGGEGESPGNDEVVSALGSHCLSNSAEAIPAAEALASSGSPLARNLVLLALANSCHGAAKQAAAVAPAAALMRVVLICLEQDGASSGWDAAMEAAMVPMAGGLPSPGSQSKILRKPVAACAASARGCLRLALSSLPPDGWEALEKANEASCKTSVRACSLRTAHLVSPTRPPLLDLRQPCGHCQPRPARWQAGCM